jgi:hypothetical protein
MSAAATRVSSLQAPLITPSVIAVRAGPISPSGRPGICARSATAAVSFLAAAASTWGTIFCMMTPAAAGSAKNGLRQRNGERSTP